LPLRRLLQGAQDRVAPSLLAPSSSARPRRGGVGLLRAAAEAGGAAGAVAGGQYGSGREGEGAGVEEQRRPGG